MISFCRRLFGTALCLFASISLHAAPDWTINPAALGTADLEGQLAIALPMGPAAGSAPEFGLQLQLVHTASKVKLKASERDARIDLLRKAAKLPPIERPKPAPAAKAKGEDAAPADPQVEMYRSAWVIPQLTSFLYPANRDRLVWRPPGGGEIIFTREEMDAKRYTPEGWFCTEVAPGVYRLNDREGWAWQYKDGLPVTLTAPSGRLLTLVHEQGLLTRIIQRLSASPADHSTAKDILRVDYDPQRRPLRVVAGVIEHRFTYDAATGHLTAWQSTGLGHALNEAAVKEAVNEANPETDPALNLDAGAPVVEGRAMGSVRFAYPADVLEALRLPNGKIQRFKWDLKTGKLKADNAATYASSGSEATGYTLTRTDKAGRVTRVAQDVRRAELVTTHPDGTREAVAYQRRAAGRGLLRERRDHADQVLTRIDYNTRHLPVRIRTLGEPEIRQIYDAQDRLIEVWRAPGAPIAAGPEAGAAAKEAEAAAPRGQRIRVLTYAGDSRLPATITDAAGRTTRHAYDARNQLVEVVAPDGGVMKLYYDMWGRLTQRMLPGGKNQEEFAYDEQGRVRRHGTPDGRTVHYIYDKAGRLESRTEGENVFVYRYDEAGRPVEVQRNRKSWWKWQYTGAVPTFPPAAKAPVGWTPQPSPGFLQVVALTDERGGVTRRHYDADGRLIAVVNPLGETTSYRYNAAGEALGWTDGRGHALLLERDKAGRIVRQANALGQVLTWKYDSAGRLVERTNGEQIARYRYDLAGRLESIDYGAGQRVDYLRDDYGRLVSATTAEVNTRYAYDELDRVIRVEQRPRNAEASGLAYTYGPGGQKRDVTLLKPGLVADLVPAGVTTTVHDEFGRIAFIDVDGKREATHVYDANTMRLSSKVVGNGMRYRYAYDAEGRLAALAVEGGDGVVRQRLTYEWDEFGLLARRVLERPGAVASSAGPVLGQPAPVAAPAVGRVEIAYAYDALGRLVSASSPQDPRQTRRYAYDAAGNLIENRSHDRWLTMEYDAANQLVVRRERGESEAEPPSAETRFAYDRAGRMLSEQVDGRLERKFTYGYLDKVMRVDRPEGRVAHYAYDAAGMLVRKATQGGDNLPGQSPRHETWVWDGLALVQRGDEYFVNEPHLAGGQTLMSRSLNPEPQPDRAP